MRSGRSEESRAEVATEETVAIIMLSIGERPWAKYTKKTFEFYCLRHGYDFFFVDSQREYDELDLPALEDARGRRNKKVYAAKIFLAWKYMALFGYHRVAVIDDSCSVTPECPPVFNLVPYGALGGTETRLRHAKTSFDDIERFSKGGDRIVCDTTDYLGGTLLIYSRSMIGAIAPERIRQAAELLYNPLPHQTLNYYLVKSGGVDVYKIPREFRRMPGLELPDSERWSL
ncbi:MAG: hypothetical protein U5R46_03335, partial [Gammaproteobacteria bacterium]|nr:hypothetical protein [Gammaproteobacteria bacterium]